MTIKDSKPPPSLTMSATEVNTDVASTTPQNLSGKELPTPIPMAYGFIAIAVAFTFPLPVIAQFALVLCGTMTILSDRARILVRQNLNQAITSGHAAYSMCLALYARCLRWFFPTSRFDSVVAEMDEDPDSDDVGKVTTRVQRMAAYAFKAAKGERSYTVANRLIAEDWVREYFSDLGMRPFDQVKHLSATVELCLIPTRFAVEAAEMAESAAIQTRRARVRLAK